MKDCKNKFFWFRYKNIIQLSIATVIVWMCLEKTFFTLHPLTATVMIFSSYIFHSYIENKALLKTLEFKHTKQESLISTLCRTSEDIIVHRDIQGNYVYCNKEYLDSFKLNFENIKGKHFNEFLPTKDSKAIKAIHNKVIQGEIVNTVIEMGYNNQIYHMLVTPIIIDKKIDGVLTMGRNITENELLQREIVKKEQLLRSVLDALPVATYLKAPDGTITYENAMAKDFLGLSDCENSNKWLYKNFRADEILCEDAEIIKSRKNLQRDKIITLKNNEERWFNITKCPIIAEDNQLVGILGVARDIELEKAAQNQRETYVATLTHDLKTPTIAQIKALDLLLDETLGPVNKEQLDMLKLIKDSCNYMYNMLSTLLSTYKYENGDFVLNIEENNFNLLVEESCTELDTMLKEKNIKINISSVKNLKPISFDKIKIKRVLINLLNNAISYAYDNTVVSVVISKHKDFINVKIINKSPYINPSVLDSLFEKYVTHASKYNKIGVGLGLYLSKQIIHAHKGTITATSYKDNKNVFEFTLPIHQDVILEKAF